MNAILALEKRLRERFPKASTVLDRAENAGGPWFLDIDFAGHPVVVEWRPGRGFGVNSKRSGGYGEGPDEIVPDLETAFRRVTSLLLAGARTRPPEAVRLRELRSARGLSQEELAKRLRVNQAAVSKLEKRSDLRLRTLREVVAALGGELILRVRFPDGEKELCFEDDRRANAAAARSGE